MQWDAPGPTVCSKDDFGRGGAHQHPDAGETRPLTVAGAQPASQTWLSSRLPPAHVMHVTLGPWRRLMPPPLQLLPFFLPAEKMRLQGFPHSMRVKGSLDQQFRQVGQ